LKPLQQIGPWRLSQNLIAFTSLSKRSNVPGMRSGFVAGDAKIIKQFLLYRTYHGSAMSPVVQQASIAAWNDEAHVVANREMYRQKFAQVTPLLASCLDVALPDAGFYLWADVTQVQAGMDDVRFAQELLAQYNVSVLPGSLLAREAQGREPRSQVASVWHWWPTPPNAWKLRSASVLSLPACVTARNRFFQNFFHCKSNSP
jgi:N-succinyldiaminopimelate aminotransferase